MLFLGQADHIMMIRYILSSLAALIKPILTPGTWQQDLLFFIVSINIATDSAGQGGKSEE